MAASLPATAGPLIEMHLAFARRIACSMARALPPHVDVEELVSDAYLGLVEAAESFDQRRGTLFRSFAARRIRGAILDGLRQRQHTRRTVPDPVLASMESPITEAEGREVPLRDTLAGEAEPTATTVERRDLARFILLKLDPRSRECVRRCWMEEAKQVEVALDLGICQPLVSRTLDAARKQVRELLPEEA